MLTSLNWINRYLSPGDLTPDDAVRLLEATCFPIEERTDLPNGDTRLDVELTSNRGDCFSHLALARDLAAVTGRALTPPDVHQNVTQARDEDPAALNRLTSVHNTVPDHRCPRFTARVIRGVSVGPSPRWLVDALEAVGQRSINAVVDLSNFVLFELGHPNHAFDLNTLDERRLVVRHAEQGETIAALDGKTHTLNDQDLVVADASKPVSVAGILGGADTGVTEQTTDLLLEVATWDPATIRRTARRLDVRTDAGYRFERVVDPRNLEHASDRLASLILDVAGGELLPGFIDAGAPLQPNAVVRLRAARCTHVLGLAVPNDDIARILTAVGFTVRVTGSGDDAMLDCTVPPERHDVTREIDLIEEVCRLHGEHNFPVAPTIALPLTLNHPKHWHERRHADAAIARRLTGLGFYETVTFSFLPKHHAEPFVPPGLRLLKVDEERRKGSPFLRPSIVPSLLTCRKANQDGQAAPPQGVRLFEIASVFAERDDKPPRQTVEHRKLAILADIAGLPGTAGLKGQPLRQAAVRALTGVIDTLLKDLAPSAAVNTTPPLAAEDAPDLLPAFADGVVARLALHERPLGWLGIPGTDRLGDWGLDQPVVVAELDLQPLVDHARAERRVTTLPAFPAIERDISLVLQNRTAWRELHQLVRSLQLDRLESIAFVGAFRGKPIAAGSKSVTLRLTFRDPERTLRHEEVDPQVNAVVQAAQARLDAQLRA